jgi:hypothetical protein
MRRREAIIIEDLIDGGTKLPEMLRSLNLNTRYTTFSREDKSLRTLTNPTLFAEIDGDNATIQQRVTDLVQMKFLLQFPIVVIGPGVENFSVILGAFFKAAVTVETPYAEGDLEAALAQLDDLTEGVDLPQSGTNNIERVAFTSNFTDVFSKDTSYFKLLAKNLHGREYLKATTPEQITDKTYLPNSPNAREAALDLSSTLDRWEVGHLHRTAFAAFNILVALDLVTKNLEDIKIAALLFSWNMADNQELTRTDLLRPDAKDVREEAGRAVLNSSDRVRYELGHVGAAEIITKIGKILKGEEIDPTDTFSLIGGIILASDMMDRICWQSGAWDPASAHKILTRCKIGLLKAIPADIVSCILKMILEAVEATLPRRVLPKGVPPIPESDSNEEKRELNSNEKRIALSSLTPGMRLKRPLKAFDGKIIIEEKVILDADMIWRIWSLSAVKALNTPLVVELLQ